VLLETTEMYSQKLHYIHQNPVTAAFVAEPWHWLYSSASDYYTGKNGLLTVELLEGF
jgi:putative transposase